MEIKDQLNKFWNFVWHEDSFLSWLVNVVLAFILVKFIIYPGLGFLLGTSYPVVAVVSCSMEHNTNLGMCSLDHEKFENWFEDKEAAYDKLGITKREFLDYRFMNGFNKGDLMVLTKAKNIKRGDIIVFYGGANEPIIHRIVSANINYQTKGDNNPGSRSDEINIGNERIIGKAWLRIPYLGWLKVWFNNLIALFLQ